MRKNSLKMKSLTVLPICFVMLVCCTYIVLAASRYVHASELPQQTAYEEAVKLAELLKNSGIPHNKLYTAEQEAELQALVDSVCSGSEDDRERVEKLLACIFERLEPGDGYQLNGWDTLCDSESYLINPSGATVGKKKAVNEQVYCFTFYDVCRLAGIPCFILEDCQVISSNNRYLAMVYIEKASESGKDWHFVNMAAEKMQLVSREDAYEILGTDVEPQNLVLDYDGALYFRNVISLSKDSRVAEKNAPKLVYDSTTNTVKAYFTGGTLASGEQYYMTEEYLGEDGVAPSGWIETKDYSSGTVTTYRSYAVFGVFLRGRIEKDGKEYELQTNSFYSFRPYYDQETVKKEPESEEHRASVSAYQKELENRAISYAKALLADKNYIWDDINLSAEDDSLLREAVNTALDWNYINNYDGSAIAFETAGISLSEEDKDHLSDKAKAQAILLYIKRNVKSVEMGADFVNSAAVLRQKEGTCGGISLLYRDMCVVAGVPCFQLRCSLGTKLGDTLFGDHGDNLIKVGNEWLFCDPTNSGVIGKGNCFQLSFLEGYDTANTIEIYLDRGAFRKDNYVKWNLGTRKLNYFEFDSEGKLGIYQRNRYGEPITNSETDENGRYIMENGLHTVDIPEMSEDGSAEIVTRYTYYYQNLRILQGKKKIDGIEYNFETDVKTYPNCHKLQEVSRRYVISKLTFQPLEDQPYEAGGVCPIPRIYHGEKKLEYGKDFIVVEYKHNKELTTYADASYRVEGIGCYMGEATRYFKVVQADISGCEVKLSPTSYTWKPDMDTYDCKPDVDLGLFSQDYSVAYYNYNKIGKAKVVITGKGNYKGSVTKEYDINPCVFNEEEFIIIGQNGQPLQSQKFYYNSSPINAGAKLYWTDEYGRRYQLFEESDYDIFYSGTDHLGTATVTVTGRGKFQGTLTCTYEIVLADGNSGTSSGNEDNGNSGSGDGNQGENDPSVEDTTTNTPGTGNITPKPDKTTTPKAPTAPKISSLTAKNKGITVKWNKIKNASGYYVYCRAGKGSWKKTATVKKSATVYTDKTAVKNGVTYQYRIYAYTTSGKTTVKSKASVTKKIIYLTAPRLSGAKNNKTKAVTVKYGKNSKASGYEICYSTSAKFAKGNQIQKVASAKCTSKVVKKLKKGKTYHVRVRAFKKSGKTTFYSSWSNSRNLKITK